MYKWIYPITDTPCTRTVNGHTLEGRIWNVRPHQLGDADTSAAAVAYRTRNPYTTKYVPIEAYLGIPYAEQPLGYLRWRPAQMKSPDRDMVCTSWGSVSQQGYGPEGSSHNGESEWGNRGSVDYASYGSREAEDCLRLHVYVPTTPAPVGGWPVFTWFHGGGSNYLTASTNQMLPHRAVVEGMIFVVVEYRLGTLGNWWHPDMETEAGYNGVNFSLTDAMAALEWVQANITAFGGNSSKVTIGGSSAGGNMCSNLLLHPYAKTLFHQAWLSSASSGTNIRWVPKRGINMGFENWHGVRHEAISAAAPYLKDIRRPSVTLAAQIEAKGFLPAIREHLDLKDFEALDGGGRSWRAPTVYAWKTGVYRAAGAVVVYKNEYYSVVDAHTSTTFAADLSAGKLAPTDAPKVSSKSLTIMNDGYTCLWPNNRTAAMAGAFTASHPVMICVAQQESSTIGLGLNPFNYDREAQDLCRLNMAEFASSPIANTEHDGSIGVAWSEAEIKRQIFNFGYQHTAYHVAQSVASQGGDAWLMYGNYKMRASGDGYFGHSDDVWFIFGTINAWSADSEMRVEDVFVADGLIKALRNFCHTGNPNTAPSLTGAGLDLFASPWAYSFSKFSTVNRNWNVIGSVPWRSALSSTPDMTTRNNFWQHVWDFIDAKLA